MGRAGSGDPAERELLWAAAMLHDIGMSIDYDDHHKHSRYLILNAGLPGFSPRETALIGQMARYHRKGSPTLGQFSALGARRRRRAAHALLRRAAGGRAARALARSGGRPRPRAGRRTAASSCDLEAHEDVSVARWAAQEEAELFKTAFGRDLEVSVGRRARTTAR